MKNDLKRIYNLLYKQFGPRNWWPGDTRLEIIVGAILTQNTAWANVEKAIKNLKSRDLLKIDTLSRLPKKKLARLIKPAGYYNIKAARVKNFLDFLRKEYNGSLTRMFRTRTQALRKKLLGVNGIGPETADSILLYAGGKPVFVVDAYTKRIFSRHRFIDQDADYTSIQNFFLKNLPRDAKMFNEFHALIVELGKDLCKASKPLCDNCSLRRIKNG